MKSHFSYAFSLCCCLAVLVSGCSGMQQLTGTVTYDDGSPVTFGSVVFVQGNFQSRGTIRSDGTYVVGTNTDKDGMPRGEYQVYITGALEQIGTEPGGDMPIFASLIDEKYTQPETSGLTYKTGTSPFNIVVERAAKR